MCAFESLSLCVPSLCRFHRAEHMKAEDRGISPPSSSAVLLRERARESHRKPKSRLQFSFILCVHFDVMFLLLILVWGFKIWLQSFLLQSGFLFLNIYIYSSISVCFSSFIFLFYIDHLSSCCKLGFLHVLTIKLHRPQPPLLSLRFPLWPS